MIVLEGRKCTLFDAGTGEDQILVVDAVGKGDAITAGVLLVVPKALLPWIVAWRWLSMRSILPVSNQIE